MTSLKYKLGKVSDHSRIEYISDIIYGFVSIDEVFVQTNVIHVKEDT